MKELLISFGLIASLNSCQKETNNVPAETLSAQTLSNVSYGSDPQQKMDIYLPAGRTDTTKMVIMVHGGAWVEGDKTDFNQFIPVLQQRLPGWAIANINYRLATTFANHFPTQENDMKAAVDFLVQKSGEYKTSQKFVLLGASAGGHMAMLQAYKNSNPKIRAVVNFFGPADMVSFFNSTTDPTAQLGLQILMGGNPTTNASMYQQSSPINFITPLSPPTIILHGDADAVVPYAQSVALQTKLQQQGVVHQLVTYPGLGHDIWPQATMTDAFNKIEVFIKANVQ